MASRASNDGGPNFGEARFVPSTLEVVNCVCMCVCGLGGGRWMLICLAKREVTIDKWVLAQCQSSSALWVGSLAGYLALGGGRSTTNLRRGLCWAKPWVWRTST